MWGLNEHFLPDTVIVLLYLSNLAYVKMKPVRRRYILPRTKESVDNFPTMLGDKFDRCFPGSRRWTWNPRSIWSIVSHKIEHFVEIEENSRWISDYENISAWLLRKIISYCIPKKNRPICKLKIKDIKIKQIKNIIYGKCST